MWTLVVYFMTDLSVKDGGWHFWVYYVILSLTAINGASLVRFMAYFAPDRDAANAIIGMYGFKVCISLEVFHGYGVTYQIFQVC